MERKCFICDASSSVFWWHFELAEYGGDICDTCLLELIAFKRSKIEARYCTNVLKVGKE